MLCRIVEGNDMSFWNPGDRAIIANNAKCKSDSLQNYVGEECVLIQFHAIAQGEHSTMNDAWEVEVMGDSFLVVERILRKPYDGHKPCTWTSVKVVTGWVPKVLETVER